MEEIAATNAVASDNHSDELLDVNNFTHFFSSVRRICIAALQAESEKWGLRGLFLVT